MPDNMRWRYGDTSPVVMAVEAETVIEIGDLVYLKAGAVWSASYGTGSEHYNRVFFRERFLGVSMQRSRVGDTSPIRIATSGVFEFDCSPFMFEVGDFVGCVSIQGNRLEDQLVAKVESVDLAIGRCVRRSPTASTRVLVDIVSTVMSKPAAAESKSGQRITLSQVAQQLERWANESAAGGWSTHQVEPMRKMAQEIFAQEGRKVQPQER